MFKKFKTMSINQRLMTPNLLYLSLLGIVFYFFFSSQSLIRNLSMEQKTTSSLMASARNTVLLTKDYLNEKYGFDELNRQYELLLKQQGAVEIESIFIDALDDLNEIDSLRMKNQKIENQINQLTESSMTQSNGYIKNVVGNLVDEQKRMDVTNLERQVIIGANVNTSANYEIKVLFAQLKEDISSKDRFFEYVNTLVKNTENDLKMLSGTPFEGMPKAALAANHEIKSLADSFVKNRQQADKIQERIFRSLEKSIDSIDAISAAHNNNFVNKIKGYFTNILIVLSISIILGVCISALVSKSISTYLTRSISSLLGASDSIATASAQVSTASQQLSEGAMTQASSVEETSASLEEMSSMTQQNSENAEKANVLMTDVSNVVNESGLSMKNLTGSMQEISQSSQDINKIIKTIDEIAFQTNLLALNAAVEAARAGEAGAGFAVVADEVRNLAMRAAEAAKSTAELIDSTTRKIKEGDGLVEKTSNSFDEVMQSSSKVVDLFAEISAASREQSNGIHQINKAVNQMDDISQQNASSAEESASAAEEMNAQAEDLKAMIADLEFLVGAKRGDRKQFQKGLTKTGKLLSSHEHHNNLYLE